MVNFVISYRISRVVGFLLLFALALSVLNSHAQDFDSEKDLQKNAIKLFDQGEFVEAFPLFSQLLSVYPDNLEYNYKLSVCMLYADPDKAKAIPYLQRVTSNLNADKKSNYYMGVAYHLNYQFNNAISAYQKYLSSAPKKEAQALSVKHKIQMCRNGLELMTHKSEISVLKKTEIKETEYFRSYDMSLFGGKLLVKPDDFKSDADKEKGERSIIYLGKDATMLFYSSYGKLGKSKDIYLVKKRANGDWGAPEILSTVINTEFDEEYPVMYPNTNVLYFCSKGHNSMGGYDIFKSEYDSSSGSWSKPVNLDFAINSADDDILYLTTPDEMIAYFSSKRSSIMGKINVYKVRLKKRPGEAPVIASTEEIISDETGELENIEEIQELAQLDVNAAEEDFKESPTIASGATAESRETSETETFTDLSNEDLIQAGKKYVEEIKQDQNKLSVEAEVSFAVASDKKEQSQEKLNEAETILARIENITDPDQKQLALQTAENLKEEATQLERQSEIAFDMSKALAADADIKQKELVTAENNAVRIESAVNSNQVDESISLLIEQKVLANSGSDAKVGVEEMTQRMKQDADLKESMASESYEKIQFMENEIAEINDEIINLNEQAESTKDPTIKEEILRQAEELDGEMKETEIELKQTYADARVFEKEAEELKVEAALFTAVSSEVMKTSSEQISDLGEPTAEKGVEEQPLTATESTETNESTEVTAPLVSIVSTEETTTETGLETNEKNLSKEELAKYDINEETVNEALTDEEVVAEVKKVEKLQEEAVQYTAEAASIREKAETIEDPEFKQNALREAEKFETVAAKKESEAATGQSSINYYSFQQNVNEFDELISNNQYLSASDLAAANSQKEISNNLFEQSKAARTKARTIEDAQEKSVELEKARQLEKEAISVQREGLNQLAVIENKGKLKEQKKMDSQMIDSDLAIIDKLQSEADELYEESKQVRLEASNNSDPEVKNAELNKAAALEKKAIQKQKNALNNYEFQSNLTKLAEVSTASEQLSPTEMTRLEKLQEEFNDLLLQSVKARVDADDTASVIASADLLERAVDLEEMAIQKQFEVMRMYGMETPEPSAKVAASGSEELALSTDSESSSEQVEMIEPEDPRTPMELIAESETQKKEAQALYDRIEIIEDPVLLMETLDKAEELEKKAEANIALARKKQLEAQATGSDTSEELAMNTNETTEQTETTETSPTTSDKDLSSGTTGSSQTEEETVSSSITASSETNASTEISEGTTPEDVIAQIMAEEELEFTASESAVTNAESTEEPPSFEEGSPGFTENEETREDINIESYDESENEPGMTFEVSSEESSFGSTGVSSPLPATTEPLTEDIFTTATTNTYTSSNPIPVNQSVPSGLIFKVQIGAFRNPIPQNLFKGISPIMGENTAMGFIRYTAGLFRKLESAGKAKKVIRDYGFGDAFVVAFYNGNRISINEARDILDGGEAPSYAISTKAAVASGSSSTSSTEGSSTASGETRTTAYGTIDLSSIKELLYTVQVGVYKNPADLGEQYGLGLLNSINTSNGFIRYTYGIFDNMSKANSAKRKMIDKGVSDAFITAYYQGSRITIAKAKTYELSNVIRVSQEGTEGEIDYSNEMDEPEIQEEPVEEEDSKKPETAIIPPSLNPETEVFMVQIGDFNNSVTVDETVAFFSLKDLGIQRHEQGDRIIYTVGSFDNYNDAEDLRKVVASKGVAEGSVVINRNDRIIPMEDFLKDSIDNEKKKQVEPDISDDRTENSEPETNTDPDSEPPAAKQPQSETETEDTGTGEPSTDDNFERELQKLLDED